MSGPTSAQKRVLKFIAQSVRERGYPPTLREISDYIGATSVHSAYGHILGLVRRGLLTKAATKSRGLALTEAGRDELVYLKAEETG